MFWCIGNSEMANYVGAVRFADGSLRFFSYQGTTDIARRILFETDDAVTHDQSYLPAARAASDEEVVEVIPYFGHGSEKVSFLSRASKSLGLITGPTSADEAMREVDERDGGGW